MRGTKAIEEEVTTMSDIKQACERLRRFDRTLDSDYIKSGQEDMDLLALANACLALTDPALLDGNELVAAAANMAGAVGAASGFLSGITSYSELPKHVIQAARESDLALSARWDELMRVIERRIDLKGKGEA